MPTNEEYKDAFNSLKHNIYGWGWNMTGRNGVDLRATEFIRGKISAIYNAEENRTCFRMITADKVPLQYREHFSLTNPMEKPKRGDRVLVRRGAGEWVKRHVSHFVREIIYCYCDGKTEWTADKAPRLWHQWKLPEVD